MISIWLVYYMVRDLLLTPDTNLQYLQLVKHLNKTEARLPLCLSSIQPTPRE